MVQETFGAGINKVSLEGAGKLYEVLAKNASQKAAKAGSDTNRAMNEYTRSIGQFNRYFQESQNTSAAAAQTESRANEAENKGRAGLHRSGMAKLSLNLQRKQDVVGAVNTLFRAGNTFASTLQQAKLQEGVIEGMKTAGEINNIADPGQKLTAVENFMKAYQEDPKDAKMQGMSRSIFPIYAGAVEDNDRKRRETVLRSALMLADNSLKMSGEKLTINMPEMQKYAKDNNVPMGEMRDSIYSMVGKHAEADIKMANSPQELNEAMTEWATVKENNFNNEFFIKSKNNKTRHLVTTTDKAIKDGIKFVQKKIKTQGQTTWGQILNNPKSATPDQVQETLDWQQLEPLERKNKEGEYSKLYADQAQDEYFKATFTDTTVAMRDMWKHAPKTTVAKAENMIGDSGFKALMNGQPRRLQEILEANPGHVKEIGNNIKTVFDRGDYRQKGLLYSKIFDMQQNSAGAKALSQTLPEGEFARILVTGTLANALPSESEDELKMSWDKAAQMLSTASTSAGNKLTPKGNGKNLYMDMEKDALDMGNNAGRFRTIVQKMYYLNADAAEANYDNVVTYFEGLTDTTEVATFGEGKDMVLDSSNAPNPITNPKTGVLPEHQEEFMSMVTEETMLAFEKQNGYIPQFSGMTFLADGVISFTDEFGNTISTVPVQKSLDAFREVKNLEEAAVQLIVKKQIKETEGKEGVGNWLHNMTLKYGGDFGEWMAKMNEATSFEE